jgi:hypothetical protein
MTRQRRAREGLDLLDVPASQLAGRGLVLVVRRTRPSPHSVESLLLREGSELMVTQECCPCGHPMNWYEAVIFAAALAGPLVTWLVVQAVKARRNGRQG